LVLYETDKREGKFIEEDDNENTLYINSHFGKKLTYDIDTTG